MTNTTTKTIAAMSLRRGDTLIDGRRVTAPWKAYKAGTGWGSVGIDGKRVKFYQAEAVEIEG